MNANSNQCKYFNGCFSGGSTKSGRFNAYISPYMVVSNGGNYSKHIYMGSQRIVSKLSNSGIFAASPVTTIHQQARYTQQTNKIKERFDSLGVIYNGSPQTGSLISVNPTSTASSYFYHSDHLGSSSLITDGTGALVQHIEYVPFGETFIDERNGSWSTPYLFNGKEKDEKTGLHYYEVNIIGNCEESNIDNNSIVECLKKIRFTPAVLNGNNTSVKILFNVKIDLYSVKSQIREKLIESSAIRLIIK